MADIQKRAKQTRKQAAKRAGKTKKRARASVKSTRKAVGKTSMRTRGRRSPRSRSSSAPRQRSASCSSGGKDEQRYPASPTTCRTCPTALRPTTPPPGAGTLETGADTGSTTETERARVEQTS